MILISGDIVPPENFKRYSPRSLPPLSPTGDPVTTPVPENEEEYTSDLFGQKVQYTYVTRM